MKSSPHRSVLFAVALLSVGCAGAQTSATGPSISTPTPGSTAEVKGYERLFFRLEELPPTLKPPCFPKGDSRKGCFGQDESAAVCIDHPNYEKCDLRALREPDAGLRNVWPTFWDYAAIGPDDRTLILAHPANPDRGCDELHHVEIRENAQAIVLTVYEGWSPRAGDSCHAVLISGATYLALPSELGDRQLLDGEPIPEVDVPAP